MSPHQECEAQTSAKGIEQRRGKSTHNGLVDKLEDAGFNPGILDAEIPVAQHVVERINNEDEQVAQFLAQKGAFSASAIWNMCGTQFRNADVVIKAQRAQLAVEQGHNTCSSSRDGNLQF